MGVFDKLGGAMIANAIKTNVLKAVDTYVESSVLNALLPHAAEDGTKSVLKLNAGLKVTISDCEIRYIQHMGKDEAKTMTLPLTEKDVVLSPVIPVKRPRAMSGSEKLDARNVELTFSGTLDGVSFREMMMGAGATIESVSLKLKITGEASGEWLVPAEPEPEAKA